MMSHMGKPHTSSGHVTTKTIKAHSNYVLATSDLFNTRENAPLPLHTLDSSNKRRPEFRDNAEKTQQPSDRAAGLTRFPVSTTFSDLHGPRSMQGVLSQHS